MSGIAFNLYRGKKPYTYSRRTKRVEKRNPISGHCWAEHIPLNVWDISSPLVGDIMWTRSEERAKELCEELGSVHVYMPLTQREFDKIRHTLV